MYTCHYCGAVVTDLESHAETSLACARKALEFMRALTPEWYGNRAEHAAALRRARKRIAHAKALAEAGYEAIVIDGIACAIGWSNTDYGDDWEEHYVVLRHGCQIGKAVERDNAIADALKTLQEPASAWLREPRPYGA